MNPLLMDAVITAHQDELRRAARRSLSTGRRTSRVRALFHTSSSQTGCSAPADPVTR